MGSLPSVGTFVGAVLGVEAHRGSLTHRSSFVGQATFDGVISVMLRPRAQVAALLPADLLLAEAAYATPDLHPVVLLFGTQRAGSILMAGVPVDLAITYHESMLAVPCVRHVRGAQLHTFSAIMHTDNAPARWSGNSYYGYAKHMADLGWSGGSFVISELEGAVIAHARIEAGAEWFSAHDPAAAALQTIRGYFDLPILGRKEDGTYVASHFEWCFDHAAVRPVNASLSVEGVLAGLPPGVHADAPSGSVQVRGMRWRVSWPFVPRL